MSATSTATLTRGSAGDGPLIFDFTLGDGPRAGQYAALAVETRGYTDLVAERATTLGGAAHGTLQAAAQSTALPAFPPDERAQTRLLEELAQRLDRVVADLREAIDTAADEPVTQDLYIGVAQGLEKQRWMLRAHLARRGGNGRAG